MVLMRINPKLFRVLSYIVTKLFSYISKFNGAKVTTLSETDDNNCKEMELSDGF